MGEFNQLHPDAKTAQPYYGDQNKHEERESLLYLGSSSPEFTTKISDVPFSLLLRIGCIRVHHLVLRFDRTNPTTRLLF